MRLAERLALHRPELRAWALYDWANSAFYTTVITAVFPPFFQAVAAKGLAPAVATSRFAVATTISLIVVAILAPLLGTVADLRPVKKRFLGGFMGLGVLATLLLATIGTGEWLYAIIIFGVANVGIAGSFVFYDALLPHIASDDELDRVSTAGYALGYLGGGLLLALNLAWISKPALFGLPSTDFAVRLSFLSVAVWWSVFAIPLFRRVPEPKVRLAPPAGRGLVGTTFSGLAQTLRELRRYRQAFLFMVAFLLFNDGISTIIRMAALFGAEKGIDQGTLIGAILLVQFIGIPCTFLFGQLASHLGAKRGILVGLVVYCIVGVLAYRMSGPRDFLVLAVLVGLVQGGTQALSRSLFASLIPRAKSSEFFGLFAVFEKFAGIFGPGVFALAVAFTGSSAQAILSVIPFFLVGGGLLLFVDVDAGQTLARASEESPSAAAGS